MTQGSEDKLAIGIGDVIAAQGRLAGRIATTPLIDFAALAPLLGFRLLVKAEIFQVTGSFKFRGALNKLLQLREEDPAAASVVAYSSGNHAQGVAAAAKALGFKATIVMPQDAPAIKAANTRGYGAEIVFYRRQEESREAITEDIARRTKAAIVRPFDDPAVMAGQGTAGLEIVAQAAAMGLTPDAVLAPASGGGLVSGIATAVKHHHPAAEIYVVEPADFDDHARSLAAGERLSNAPGKSSICDALMSEKPGELTFPINRRLLAGALSVDDRTVLSAMRFAMLVLKMVVEPGGVSAIAAAVVNREKFRGKTVVAVASGGNADPEMIARALASPDLIAG